MTEGIVTSIVLGLGWVEIKGSEGIVAFFCLLIGLSAICYGLEALKRMREGGEI